MNKFIVEKFSKFGKWTVLGPQGKLGIHWQILCICECGFKKFVTITSLISGKSYRCRKCASTTHGERKSSEYVAWNNMRIRCYSERSKDYHNYGGRGIIVCDRWKNSFKNFLTDMGKKPTQFHSLDRRDSNGNYEPLNCRWVTGDVQARNRRNVKRNVKKV